MARLLTLYVEVILINSQQLPLPVSLPDDETFASFYVGQNQLLLDTLIGALNCQGFNLVYFWSAGAAGRTHLLHAACSEMANKMKTAYYVPLDQFTTFSPEILDGLEQYDLVCLDNIDAIKTNNQWEEAIFDLFNRLYERQQTCFFVTANLPPANLGLQLPDLTSRLTWGQVYQLSNLQDEEKLAALQLRANLRGFEINQDVGLFLLKRLNRDMRSLFTILEKLDIATITKKRKITIPFVKEILSL